MSLFSSVSQIFLIMLFVKCQIPVKALMFDFHFNINQKCLELEPLIKAYVEKFSKIISYLFYFLNSCLTFVIYTTKDFN